MKRIALFVLLAGVLNAQDASPSPDAAASPASTTAADSAARDESGESTSASETERKQRRGDILEKLKKKRKTGRKDRGAGEGRQGRHGGPGLFVRGVARLDDGSGFELMMLRSWKLSKRAETASVAPAPITTTMPSPAPSADADGGTRGMLIVGASRFVLKFDGDDQSTALKGTIHSEPANAGGGRAKEAGALGESVGTFDLAVETKALDDRDLKIAHGKAVVSGKSWEIFGQMPPERGARGGRREGREGRGRDEAAQEDDEED